MSLYLVPLLYMVGTTSAKAERSFVTVGVHSWVNETRWGEMARGLTLDDSEPPEQVPLNTLAVRTSFSQRLKDEWFLQAGLNLLDTELDPRAVRLSGMVSWQSLMVTHQKAIWKYAETPFGIGEGYGDTYDTFSGEGYYLIGGPPRSDKVVVNRGTYTSTSLLKGGRNSSYQFYQIGLVFDSIKQPESSMDGIGFRFTFDDFYSELMDPTTIRHHTTDPCDRISDVCWAADYRVGLWRVQDTGIMHKASEGVIPYLEARNQFYIYLGDPRGQDFIARLGTGIALSLFGPGTFMTDTVFAMTPELFIDMGGRF